LKTASDLTIQRFNVLPVFIDEIKFTRAPVMAAKAASHFNARNIGQGWPEWREWRTRGDVILEADHDLTISSRNIISLVSCEEGESGPGKRNGWPRRKRSDC